MRLIKEIVEIDRLTKIEHVYANSSLLWDEPINFEELTGVTECIYWTLMESIGDLTSVLVFGNRIA